jgi:uncharacterized membrane protein YphA (DoxX/SURF4 family)
MGTNILKNFKYVNLTYNLFSYLIAVVLLFSGTSKIIDPTPMIETLKVAFKLNENLLILAATLLPIIEIVLGLLLVIKIQTKKTLLAVIVLFFVFFAFSIYGTAIGLNVDCGCFGGAVKSEFGITMIIRNLVLLITLIWIENVNIKLALRGNN